jgi:outer membrane protein assembly factor BamA
VAIHKQSATDEIRDVKITQARMVQMPNFGFILPNSEIRLAVHQQVSSTTFDVASRYDMINTYFNIGFDLRYNFSRYFAGASLDDTIFFELNLGPATYFQRTHNITPYFGYNLGKFTKVKIASAIGNTITASVDQIVKYDKGNTLVESIGIKYDTADPRIHVPNGSMLSCTLFGSYRGTGSDYEYTKGEIDIKNTYMPLKWDYLESYFKFYFPMTTDYRPISDVYLVGGYEILRGYGYNEFYGDTLMYGKLNYHIPILRNLKRHALRTAVHILTIDFTAETAQIGNARDFGNGYNMKSSVSAGIGCDVVMFDHINLKFDTFSGKAIESGRIPVLYFILTAYTYFEI